MGTEVALLIEVKNPLEVFSKKNGLDGLIDQIEQKAKSQLVDISTEEGRDNVRSLAFEIAKSKKAIEKMGKELTSGLREQVNTINEERDRGVERLQKLQDEIRQPLTEFENKEKERCQAHEDAIAAIEQQAIFEIGVNVVTSAQAQERLDRLPALFKRDWEEFNARAIQTHERVAVALTGIHAAAKKHEDEQAELARLRKEQAEREQRERDERLKAEAAEAARKEAEEKAAREQEERDRAAKAEQERLQREREEADARAAAAEKKAADDAAAAEKALKDAEEKRIADLKAADEKAEREKAAALKKQQDDAAAEKARQEEAERKRAADIEHKGTINREVLAALQAYVDADVDPAMRNPEAVIKSVIKAIANGKVPHVKISY